MTYEQTMIQQATEFGRTLGRKFDAEDVLAHDGLFDAATSYAKSYVGSFSYMLEMRTAANTRRGLSAGQAKGVLNCLMAEDRRNSQPKGQAAPAAELPNVGQVPSARYRVVADNGASVAVRLDSAAWAGDKPKGTRTVAIRTGEGWTNLGFADPDGTVKLWRKAQPFEARLAPALKTLAEGVEDGSWLVYALSYAQEGSECAFCGSDLDTQESLTVGYGPTCAKRHGLPWGPKAEPMTVVLARAKGQETAPQPAAKRSYDQVFDDAEDARILDVLRDEVKLGPPAERPAPKLGGSLLDMAREIESRRAA